MRRVSETTATTETAKAAEATEATDTARKEETGGSTTELAEPAHNRLLLIKGDLALVQRVLMRMPEGSHASERGKPDTVAL